MSIDKKILEVQFEYKILNYKFTALVLILLTTWKFEKGGYFMIL